MIEKETAEFEGRPVKAVRSPEQTTDVQQDTAETTNGTRAAKREGEAENVDHGDTEQSMAEAKEVSEEREAPDKSLDPTNSDDPPAEVPDSQANEEDSGKGEAANVGETATAVAPTEAVAVAKREPDTVVAEEQKPEDDEGDHVVEGEEDTVIY